MFERFTERARQIVVLAQEHAREFESEEIDSPHILLACYREEEGLAAKALRYLNVSEGVLRDQIPFGKAGKHSGQQLPFTPEAKGVFELALREALSLGHNYIGDEHILLGLLRDQPALVRKVVEPNALHSEMMRRITESRGAAKKTLDDEPLTVSFDIKVGEVWVDPDGVSWYVKFIATGDVHLERTFTHTEPARDLVRKWRKMGDKN